MKHETEFLPAALEILERPASPAGRAIAWALMVFFAIAVVWAMFGRIDIVATAQGKIIPSGRSKIIQPMEIGVVRTIHVKEGQKVNKGDVLIELDPTSTQAELGQLVMELTSAQLDQIRLRKLEAFAYNDADVSEASIDFTLEFPQDLVQSISPSVLKLQEQMLRSEWAEHQARMSALDNTIQSREADLAATRHEVKKIESTLPLITRRAEALKGLVKQKMGPEQAWLELEEQRVAQEQELASLKNRVKQVAASIEEARQQRRAMESEFRRQLLTNLTETERKIQQLKQERIKVSQRNALQRLIAPVDGEVQQLAIHTIGGVVTPAQELMKIVPESEALEVEAWILNKDIGFVEEGQTAEIKVETFNFTKYGTIDAKVIDVSNDAITDEEKGLIYAGRVLMEQSVIQVGEKLVNLTPGMSVSVEVKTGKRRLIEYILSPLLRYKQESLGER